MSKGLIKIKICGVTSVEMANIAVDLGANFVGIIFEPTSKRAVKMDLAKQISSCVKHKDAIPVAVFVNHDAREMNEICQKTGINVVQLHGDIARKSHYLLPEYYHRIYVQPVLHSGEILDKYINKEKLKINPQRDYILFDAHIPGKGVAFNWDYFSQHYLTQYLSYKYGIAGGLTYQNVNEAMKVFHPHFVDVSSGVENKFGQKDKDLIANFVGEMI